MRVFNVLLSLFFIFSFLACAKADNPDEIKVQVKVDDQLVSFSGASPYIDKKAQRTMVPIRFVAEQLGATVNWNGEQQLVTIERGQQRVELTIGQTRAIVNGKPITIDAKPLIKDKRTYVPIRFVSEALGVRIGWEAHTQTVVIHSELMSEGQVASDKGIYGIYLGQKAEQVIQRLGQPSRKDPSPLGYEWWVYNDDLKSYVQIGLKDGEVVDIYSNASSWNFRGVQIGTGKERLFSLFTFVTKVQFDYDGAQFTLENQLNERPVVMIDGTPTILYLDLHDQQKVTGIRMIRKDYLVKSKNYALNWTYSNNAPNVNAPSLTPTAEQAVKTGLEKQVLDLANVSRSRNGLSPLAWHEQAAKVARSHSLEMLNHGYFDHDSALTGLSPFDRLKKGGVSYRMAGENIASGYHDAIEVHHGWMNSLGHRKNILQSDFEALGVGVVGDHFTQNFITP